MGFNKQQQQQHETSAREFSEVAKIYYEALREHAFEHPDAVDLVAAAINAGKIK